MKKLLLLAVLTSVIMSCEKDDTNATPTTTVYDIEGKWLWSPSENRADANTMYEFADGTRYTYYASANGWTTADWNLLDSSDRIPGTETYTFDEDTLTIDETPQVVTFECEGGILNFINGGKIWRLSSDCE